MAKKNGASPSPTPAVEEPRTFDLDRVDPSDAVRIDGESYRLARVTDLPIIQKAAVRRALKRMGHIEEKDAPTEADQREHRKLAEEITHIALPDMAPALAVTLSIEQLGEVVYVFFARTAMMSPIVKRIREMGPSSPSSLPASNAPTPAAIP